MKKIISVFVLFCMVIVLGTSCSTRNKNYEEIKLEKEYVQMSISNTGESAGFISEDGSVDILDKEFKVKKNVKLEIEGKNIKTAISENFMYPAVFFDGKNIYVDNSDIGENKINVYDINGEILKSTKFDDETYLNEMHDFENRTFFELYKMGEESSGDISTIVYLDENYDFVEVPGLGFVKDMYISNYFKVDNNSFTIVCTQTDSNIIKIVTIKDDLTFEIEEDDLSNYNSVTNISYLISPLYVKSKYTFYKPSNNYYYLEKVNKDGETKIVSKDIRFLYGYNINEVFYFVNYEKNGTIKKILKYYPLKEKINNNGN